MRFHQQLSIVVTVFAYVKSSLFSLALTHSVGYLWYRISVFLDFVMSDFLDGVVLPSGPDAQASLGARSKSLPAIGSKELNFRFGVF